MADELDLGLTEILSSTFAEIEGAAEDILKEVGDEAVAELAQTSPKDTGDYASKWQSNIMREYGTVKVVVSNKKYQLTHLLENGTTTADGTQRTRAQPHIGPASENAVRKALEMLGDDE